MLFALKQNFGFRPTSQRTRWNLLCVNYFNFLFVTIASYLSLLYRGGLKLICCYPEPFALSCNRIQIIASGNNASCGYCTTADKSGNRNDYKVFHIVFSTFLILTVSLHNRAVNASKRRIASATRKYARRNAIWAHPCQLATSN